MDPEKPKHPILSEMDRLAAEGAFERHPKEEKPIRPIIRELMAELATEESSQSPAIELSDLPLANEKLAAGLIPPVQGVETNRLFREQAATARIGEEGDVEAPDRSEGRYYIDPDDGQLYQRETGKKLPPHSRTA